LITLITENITAANRPHEAVSNTRTSAHPSFFSSTFFSTPQAEKPENVSQFHHNGFFQGIRREFAITRTRGDQGGLAGMYHPNSTYKR
jgi:hypothetical protein